MAECLIWGTPARASAKTGDAENVTSDRAGGNYTVTRTAISKLAELDEAEKAKLTTWLVDQRRLGEERPKIDSRLLSRLAELPDLRVGERLDRVLLWREACGDKVGQQFRLEGTQDEGTARTRAMLLAWTGSADRQEVHWLLRRLIDELMLDRIGSSLAVSLNGWRRLEEMRRVSIISSQAFVAMWFSPETTPAYEQGIEPAIRECGYDPLRIDKKEHVNKIDDEIIAEIRRSRFVVADFTSERDRPRGGVYFEAGFAYGLNRPVIWTCRADLIDQVHFDTRQFNHIAWEDPEELRIRLRNRIAAVVGDGPGKSQIA